MNLRSNSFANNKMTFLPNNYELGEFDVICGRGNESYSHKGNQIFREIVMSQVQRFKSCRSKWEKTRVISDVIDHFQCLSGSGGFIRLDMESWRYYQISNVLAVSSHICWIQISVVTRLMKLVKFYFYSAKKYHKLSEQQFMKNRRVLGHRIERIYFYQNIVIRLSTPAFVIKVE